MPSLVHPRSSAAVRQQWTEKKAATSAAHHAIHRSCQRAQYRHQYGTGPDYHDRHRRDIHRGHCGTRRSSTIIIAAIVSRPVAVTSAMPAATVILLRRVAPGTW